MRLIIVLLFTLTTVSAFADQPIAAYQNAQASYITQPVFSYINTSELLDNCQRYLQKNGNAYNTLTCSLYIAGIIDELNNSLALRSTINTDCYDKSHPGVSLDQVIRIFVKRVEDHPEELNIAPASIISGLYLVTFPIPKKCYIKNKDQSLVDRISNWIKND